MMLETTKILPVVTAVLGTISILSLMDAITKLVMVVIGNKASTAATTSRRSSAASNKLSLLILNRLRSIQLPFIISLVCMISYVYLCSHLLLLQQSASTTMITISVLEQSFYIPPPWTLLNHSNDDFWTFFNLYALVLFLFLIVGSRYSLFLTCLIKESKTATKAVTTIKTKNNPTLSSSIKGEDSTISDNPTVPNDSSSSSIMDPSSPFQTAEIKLDMIYLASHFLPTSSHYDILFFISTVPSLILYAKETIERAEQLKKERIDFLKKQKKEKERRQVELNMFDSVLNKGGWADDDDDTHKGDIIPISSVENTESSKSNNTLDSMEAIRQAKEAKLRAEKEKELLAKQVAEVTGKTSLAENIILEDVDEGVLGQKWVEETLTHVGQWPPICIKKNSSLNEITFPLETTTNRRRNQRTILVTAMDHPAVKRTLCITAGRLNSQMLNTHTELVDASQKNRVDSTYFKSAVEFRQRASIILEGSLHLAASVKSYRLAKTLIETQVMFKVGVLSISHPQTMEWFRSTMASTYGGPEGIPALEFRSKAIRTPDENEIATGDLCALELDIERKHADNFTRQKLELCAKQGIPPQIALSAYREIWWILIRAKNMDLKEPVEKLEVKPHQDWGMPLKNNLSLYENEAEENRLLHMFPFVVPNVAQKAGKLTVRFIAPKKPGRYKFFVDVKSGEFLGCDHEFTMVADVIDRNTVQRVEKPKSEKLESATNSG